MTKSSSSEKLKISSHISLCPLSTVTVLTNQIGSVTRSLQEPLFVFKRLLPSNIGRNLLRTDTYLYIDTTLYPHTCKKLPLFSSNIFRFYRLLSWTKSITQLVIQSQLAAANLFKQWLVMVRDGQPTMWEQLDDHLWQCDHVTRG